MTLPNKNRRHKNYRRKAQIDSTLPGKKSSYQRTHNDMQINLDKKTNKKPSASLFAATSQATENAELALENMTLTDSANTPNP